jgi:flavin reductase (DIM6/NTAB) family NADH-FMN oxidoreductase RutF
VSTDTPSVDSIAFREAISHFATGVTVITTVHEGTPAGITASAVSSLSLEPVLILVCINHTSSTHTAIDGSGRFVVNVLGEDDGELALHFARPSADKFASVELDAAYDLPVLKKAIAHFVCDVHERFPGGDHSIFIGLVRECAAVPGRHPLLYFRSRFGRFRDPHQELLAETAGWDAASLGSLGNIGPSQNR